MAYIAALLNRMNAPLTWRKASQAKRSRKTAKLGRVPALGARGEDGLVDELMRHRARSVTGNAWGSEDIWRPSVPGQENLNSREKSRHLGSRCQC